MSPGRRGMMRLHRHFLRNVVEQSVWCWVIFLLHDLKTVFVNNLSLLIVSKTCPWVTGITFFNSASQRLFFLRPGYCAVWCLPGTRRTSTAVGVWCHVRSGADKCGLRFLACLLCQRGTELLNNLGKLEAGNVRWNCLRGSALREKRGPSACSTPAEQRWLTCRNTACNRCVRKTDVLKINFRKSFWSLSSPCVSAKAQSLPHMSCWKQWEGNKLCFPFLPHFWAFRMAFQ